MRPPLTLVQPTTASALPAVPTHPETRTTAALHSAVYAAWQAGHEHGNRIGHVQGWRAGMLCGACWGVLLTVIAAAAARAWGWL